MPPCFRYELTPKKDTGKATRMAVLDYVVSDCLKGYQSQILPGDPLVLIVRGSEPIALGEAERAIEECWEFKKKLISE